MDFAGLAFHVPDQPWVAPSQLPCHFGPACTFACTHGLVSCSALASAGWPAIGATQRLSLPIDSMDGRLAVTNERRRPERFYAIRCRQCCSTTWRLCVFSNSDSPSVITISDEAMWPAGADACCTFSTGSTADRVARHQASRCGESEDSDAPFWPATFVMPSARGRKLFLPRR
jgi:hypothetical protein